MQRQSPRRGRRLEQALLEAGWEVLDERGYAGLTYEAVAERAHTSRPVLYRRWPTRNDLVLAILIQQITADPIVVPDTGSLRDDALQLLRNANKSRARTMNTTAVRLMEFFRASGSSYEDIQAALRADGSVDNLDQILTRAIDRGEIPDVDRPGHVVNLPLRLLRDELTMTLQPASETFIRQTIDDIWLPLLRDPHRA
jgi:AcrR family transcriptional regulator